MHKTPMFKCIIFDLDGTLVDSETLNARALSELMGPLDLSSEAIRDAYRGWKLSDVINHLAKTYKINVPDEFVASYRSRVQELYRTELRAFDGVSEALQAVNLPVCVASNAPMQKINIALEIAGLSRFFARKLFSAYDIGAWKPDPDLFIATAVAMDVQPHECLVVEDSALGLQAATAAGMTCLQFQPEPGAIVENTPFFRNYSEFHLALEALCNQVRARSQPRVS
ncbi:HAD family hydrolase [Aureimonas sp. D3]|uniref:HAD family hydrolase n=1 Tax=Aureimonas sp. D3 TaxID=1638164 RepID=UPI000784A204|nr:HAD-IA family hydrolase [Aureimonas sp. D3]